MNESYQETQKMQEAEIASFSFATVGRVYSDGVTLKFVGDTSPGAKRYKRNTTIAFAEGQRVFVQKVNGTYVVICPIG